MTSVPSKKPVSTISAIRPSMMTLVSRILNDWLEVCSPPNRPPSAPRFNISPLLAPTARPTYAIQKSSKSSTKESVAEWLAIARSSTNEIKNAPPMPSKDPKAAPNKRLRVVFRIWISKMTIARPHSRPAIAAYLEASSKGRKYQAETASNNIKPNRMINRLFTETTPSGWILRYGATNHLLHG